MESVVERIENGKTEKQINHFFILTTQYNLKNIQLN